MKNILLLEDLPEIRAWLRKLVLQVFPDSQISESARVQDALELVHQRLAFALLRGLGIGQLCHKLGARAYLSGRGGSTGYLDDEQMGRAGVGVIWQWFAQPVYPQRYPDRSFDSHLGFFDLVLNCGGRSADLLFDRDHPARLRPARSRDYAA